jgi:hypothetical protein
VILYFIIIGKKLLSITLAGYSRYDKFSFKIPFVFSYNFLAHFLNKVGPKIY